MASVGGDLILREGASAPAVASVGGDLILREGASAPAVTRVGGNLWLYEGASAPALTSVGGSLYLDEGASAPALTTVGGDLYLGEGTSAPALTSVGGDLTLYKGASAPAVTHLGGRLTLYKGASAPAVTHLGGRLTLYEGASAPPGLVAKPGGEFNQFAGIYSKTANPNSLASATSRLQAGEDAELVRQETGWFKGPDDMWRYEIDDSTAELVASDTWAKMKASVARGESSRSHKLADVLDHPHLFAAYPSLRKARVRLSTDEKGGSYDPDTMNITLGGKASLDEIRGTLLHEIQHAIQTKEGFARGGSPAEFRGVYVRLLLDLNDTIGAINHKLKATPGGTPAYDELLEERARLAKEVQKIEGEEGMGVAEKAYDEYRRLAGEVEARNTEIRGRLGLPERQAQSPASTADTPAANMILSYNGRDIAISADVIDSDAAYELYVEYFESTKTEMLQEFAGKALGATQPWEVVSNKKIQKIWDAFVATGRVDNVTGMQAISAKIVENITRLAVNTELLGHTQIDPKDSFSEIAEPGADLEALAERYAEYAVDEKGALRISDYGLGKLWKIAERLVRARGNPELQLKLVDAVLHVIHERSDLPSWFIEGGRASLDDISTFTGGSTSISASVAPTPLPETIEINGAKRPTRNSKGQLIHPTEEGTRNFWEWFGDSKVVDEQGRPKVVYHGGLKFDAFRGAPDSGAHYVSEDLDVAQGFASQYPKEEAEIKPLYLKAENILDLRDPEVFKKWTGYEPREGFSELGIKFDMARNNTALRSGGAVLEKAKASGYDSVRFYDTDVMNKGFSTSYTFLAPAQVKAAPAEERTWWGYSVRQEGNTGDFDRGRGSILEQGDEPGTPGDLPPGRTPEEVWNSMTVEQQRPYHEMWAQSWEQFALEGKAPNLEMQPIFARFRAWMISVYTSMQEFLRKNPLAGKLNDELRQVFDRLIASAESIQEAETARSFAPLFATAEEAGLTAVQYAEYMQQGADATERAIDELSSRSLRDMKWLSNAKNAALKALQDEAKTKRDAVRAEVVAEVMAEPVNQARRWLRTGEVINANGDLVKATTGFKLDLEEVKALFPAADMPDLSALRGMTGPNSLPLDTSAALFGFGSGHALVMELLHAEKAKTKIDGITDQRMLERYGELSSPADLERAAEAAIHNAARARFMATGLKILTKSPASVAQIVKASKQAAQNAIAGKKVRDLRPAQYEQAEARANKEAIKFAPKEPAKAIGAQRSALLNHQLARATQEAQAEVEAFLKYVKKFQKPGTRKALEAGYLEQIDDLLQGFDFDKAKTLTTIDKSKSLTAWIAEQEALGFEPAIDPEVMDELKRKHYKEMTIEELRGLIDSVKQIEHLARALKKLMTAQDARDFAARVAEADASIRANANRTVEERGTPNDVAGKTAQFTRQFVASHRKFSSIMREQDGGKDNGVMWNLLSRGMNEAGDNETEMKFMASQALAVLFKALPKMDVVPGNLYAKKTLAPGTTVSMTHEQRIMFGINWGTEGNRQRLLDGGMTGQRAISSVTADKILDTLTKEEWDFIQGVLKFIGKYKDQIGALEKQLTGIEPKWIDATPIHTKFGTYEGGYFPAKYDAELSSRSESLEAAANLRLGMRGAFGAAATRSSYIQERSKQVIGRPLLLSFNAISQHVSEVTHRLAWQPWIVDANRLLRALDAPIREHYGPEILRELKGTVIDIAEGDAPAKNTTEAAINRLRIGYTIVALGWSATTALIQPAGLAQSWVRIGGKWVARGVGHYLSHPLEALDFINERSLLMRSRGRTMQREINEVLNTVRAGEGLSAVKASFFVFISKMQRVVDVPTWLGAYDKGLHELDYEKGADESARKAIEETASALADQAVLDSQSGGQLKDLAGVQRGSPLKKAYTNFYSFFSATYNLNAEAYRRTDFKSPVSVIMLAADAVMLNTVPVLFSLALMEMLKGDCGDDLECLAKKLKAQQLSFLFGQMILLREVGVAVSAATGGSSYGYGGPAGLSFFADLVKTGQQVQQGEVDAALLKSANKAAGAILHYPAAQINRTVEGIIAVEEGRVEGVSILPALVAGPPRKP